jgi:shikimate 5-dehydrogenase
MINRKKKINSDKLKSKQFTVFNRGSSNSSSFEQPESVEITVMKANDRHANNQPEIIIDETQIKLKSLEKLNEELVEQNKSLKQQLLVSQSNCSLILNELLKTKQKLNKFLKY